MYFVGGIELIVTGDYTFLTNLLFMGKTLCMLTLEHPLQDMYVGIVMIGKRWHFFKWIQRVS